MTSITKNRTDHTEWVIHFVRDRDPENDLSIYADDDGEYMRQVERLPGKIEPDASGFAVLRTIIDIGALIPNHSYRNGKTTIYGGEPVVCFTEMPIYSLAKYMQNRGDPKRCSAYGIGLLKTELYGAGGRPVFYGLSVGDPTYKTNTKTAKIFDDDVLPEREQYRYVPYNPTSAGRYIDWSHEREWRWKAANPRVDSITYETPSDYQYESPALPLFMPEVDGGYFSKVCVIVWTDEEADRITDILQQFYDCGGNDIGVEYCKNIIKNSFVVILDRVIGLVENHNLLRAHKIEDMPDAAIRRFNRPNATDATKKQVIAAIESARRESAKAAKECSKTVQRNKDGHILDVCGFVHVTTYDAQSEITDALVELGYARNVGGEGYWIDAIKIDNPEQGLVLEEAAAKAAAAELERLLGQRFGIVTIWD